jgi:hypothetical protein
MRSLYSVGYEIMECSLDVSRKKGVFIHSGNSRRNCPWGLSILDAVLMMRPSPNAIGQETCSDNEARGVYSKSCARVLATR